jgi:heat shock protein HslJ
MRCLPLAVRYVLCAAFVAILATGQALAEATRVLYVAPFMAERPQSAPRLGLLIREDPDRRWALAGGPIGGFNYEWGYTYKLIVHESAPRNPLPGSPAVHRELVSKLSQTPVSAGTTLRLLLDPSAIGKGARGRFAIYGQKEFVLARGVSDASVRRLLRSPGRWRFQFTFGNTPAAPLVLLGWSHPVEGYTWHLTSLNGALPLPGVEVTAQFRHGRLAGRASVNSYSATYRLSGGSLKLGQAAATLMAGPPALMKQETTYLNLLNATARARVDGYTLTLSDAAGRPLLTFADSPQLQPEGTEWVLVSLLGEAPVKGSTLTLGFRDGRVGGSGGINSIMGTCDLGNPTLHIGDLGSTKMAGPPELMMQESTYMQALEAVTAWQIDGRCLDLRDQTGAALLTFKPAAAER